MLVGPQGHGKVLPVRLLLDHRRIRHIVLHDTEEILAVQVLDHLAFFYHIVDQKALLLLDIEQGRAEGELVVRDRLIKEHPIHLPGRFHLFLGKRDPLCTLSVVFVDLIHVILRFFEDRLDRVVVCRFPFDLFIFLVDLILSHEILEFKAKIIRLVHERSYIRSVDPEEIPDQPALLSVHGQFAGNAFLQSDIGGLDILHILFKILWLLLLALLFLRLGLELIQIFLLPRGHALGIRKSELLQPDQVLVVLDQLPILVLLLIERIQPLPQLVRRQLMHLRVGEHHIILIGHEPFVQGVKCPHVHQRRQLCPVRISDLVLPLQKIALICLDTGKLLLDLRVMRKQSLVHIFLILRKEQLGYLQIGEVLPDLLLRQIVHQLMLELVFLLRPLHSLGMLFGAGLQRQTHLFVGRDDLVLFGSYDEGALFLLLLLLLHEVVQVSQVHQLLGYHLHGAGVDLLELLLFC